MRTFYRILFFDNYLGKFEYKVHADKQKYYTNCNFIEKYKQNHRLLTA